MTLKSPKAAEEVLKDSVPGAAEANGFKMSVGSMLEWEVCDPN